MVKVSESTQKRQQQQPNKIIFVYLILFDFRCFLLFSSFILKLCQYLLFIGFFATSRRDVNSHAPFMMVFCFAVSISTFYGYLNVGELFDDPSGSRITCSVLIYYKKNYQCHVNDSHCVYM